MSAADTLPAARAASNGGAIQRPQFQSGAKFQGEEAEDSVLPRVHLFQGLPKERELYGKGPASGGKNWEEGDLIDTSTMDRLESRKFVPIFGYAEFIKFGRDNSGKQSGDIIYRHRDKASVPAADLEWNGEGATRQPPACTKFMNFVVMFEGADIPLAISFKTTSINAGRTLNMLEKMRGVRGPGMYQFDTKTKSNGKGKWLTPVIRPVGNPSPELLQTVVDIFNSMNASNVKVAVDAADLDDAGGEGSGDESAAGEFDPNKM